MLSELLLKCVHCVGLRAKTACHGEQLAPVLRGEGGGVPTGSTGPKKSPFGRGQGTAGKLRNADRGPTTACPALGTGQGTENREQNNIFANFSVFLSNQKVPIYQ